MVYQWREDQLLYIHTLSLIVIGQQLTDNIKFLDEAEHDIKNYSDRVIVIRIVPRVN